MHDAATATTAGLAVVNTTLAPCIAGLIVFALRAVAVEPKRLDAAGLCNGILAGLVAITASCSFVRPWEAIVIGGIGGFLYQASSMCIIKAQVDDVVDAFSVHGVNGLWGMLCVGLFGSEKHGQGGNGSFYGGDQIGTQLVAAICIIAWTTVLSLACFIPLRYFGLLRLGDKFQEAGADNMEHSPQKAYCGELHVDESYV